MFHCARVSISRFYVIQYAVMFTDVMIMLKACFLFDKMLNWLRDAPILKKTSTYLKKSLNCCSTDKS